MLAVVGDRRRSRPRASVPDAARDAKSFVLAALEGAAEWHLGEGRGPIDHLGWSE